MIDVKALDHALREWFHSKDAKDMVLSTALNPNSEPNEDYQVIYEAKFESNILEKATIEVWITSDGYTAIGFERWERVAKRLNIDTKQKRFAAGHEPSKMDKWELWSLLDLVAAGKIAISQKHLPLIGLISIDALIRYDDLKAKNLEEYCSRVGWLTVTRNSDSRKNITYINWNS